MIVGHYFVSAIEPKRIGMLLPLGELKHKKLADCEIGEIVYDPDGVEARIVAKTTIFAESEIADCLAKHLYGRTIETVRKKMEEKWPLEDDKLLYLIVELV